MKTKLYYDEGQNTIFRSACMCCLIGLWELKDILILRQNLSKNKLIDENAMTKVHGSLRS